MNNKDKERLERLGEIMKAVPYSKSGTATQTGVGAIQFEQDMRAVRPWMIKVIQGMLWEGLEGFEEGWDYENPDLLLTALEEWVRMREAEGWQNAREDSFRWFYMKRKTEGLRRQE